MADEWPTSSLREAHVAVIDCEHRTPPAAQDGYLYVAIPQLRAGRLDLSDARRISREHFVQWTRKAQPLVNDVVLSRRCNPGETAFVPAGLDFALGQNLVLLRADGAKIYPPFLRWLVRGPEWWAQINKFLNVGAVFDSLKCADIPELRLHIPPLDEQRAIAHVLGTLDARIDLTRRINETLEAMARRLFRSWFVDFEPVRAKADGRDTGLRKPVADLFPDCFENSTPGFIPKGWTCARLGEWVTALSGGTPSKSESTLWDGEIPWISPKAMTAIHADEAEGYVAERALGRGTRLAPAGATLVMVRGMGLHEKVRVSHVRQPVAFNQDVKALVPRGIEPSLLLFALLDAQDALLERVESSGHGTGKLPSDVLLAHPITMPNRELQAELTEHFDAINNRIALARTEARMLATLRDGLLPKLISGELRVADRERVVAVAT
jgi:type I restriction enzyme, S subunit